MISAFSSGFLLSLSLIIAIGAQNIFVLQQGLRGQFVLLTVLFCSISDAILIALGVLGLGRVLEPLFNQYGDWLLLGAAGWLLVLTGQRISSAIWPKQPLTDTAKPQRLLPVLVTMITFTWLNPHVYLDTVILLGIIALPYIGLTKLAFTVGAISASSLFFFGLGFGAKILAPRLQTVTARRILDFVTATVMLIFTVMLVRYSIIN